MCYTNHEREGVKGEKLGQIIVDGFTKTTVQEHQEQIVKAIVTQQETNMPRLASTVPSLSHLSI